MKLTEQQKEIALRVVQDILPGSGTMIVANDDFLDFAARFLAALPKPKPEPVGKVDHGRYRDTKWLRQPPPSRTLLYTESPIAPPASEQKPVAWVTTNEDGDYAMLFFDQQEARSYSGDDEPIGLAPVSASALLPDYKEQRDTERMDWLEKQNADLRSAIDAAIASAKGDAK